MDAARQWLTVYYVMNLVAQINGGIMLYNVNGVTQNFIHRGTDKSFVVIVALNVITKTHNTAPWSSRYGVGLCVLTIE